MLAVLSGLLLDVAAGAALGFPLAAAVATFTERVPEYASMLSGQMEQLELWLAGYGIRLESIYDFSEPTWMLNLATNMAQSAASFVSQMVLVLLIVAFMLFESTGLREKLELTGTHVGCDTSQCGACVVLVDGRSVKSCTMLALEAEGLEVTTIEGLETNGELHPMQRAFREQHGLQCGFCTPGVVLSTIDLLQQNPDPSEAEVRDWLEGNICRCTGYHNIVKAVLACAAGGA